MLGPSQLDLTDAQQAQVKAIMAKEKPTFKPLMLQMAQGHAQLRDLVIISGFDEAKVRELAAQQSQTMTELDGAMTPASGRRWCRF